MNDIRRVLSYNDVLLCPRNSECEHLSDANLEYQYKCLDGDYDLIPIINAPMDKVCSPELLRCLCDDFNMPVTIHRWFDSADDQLRFFKQCHFRSKNEMVSGLVFMSVGYIRKWEEWINTLVDVQNELGFGFLVDMANGDTGSCVETVKTIRHLLPGANIMAGNVATKSGYRRLEEAGANFIRVGIGGGCFVPEMMVKTNNGLKKIKDIENGDFVFTHSGKCKEVIATIKYRTSEDICKIKLDRTEDDEILCTKNHEFYVVNKKYKDVVNEDNIYKYAEWVSAENLSEEYFFIELV